MTTQLLDASAKRELIDRIAASGNFCKAPRLREFLLYVADCTIEDRPDDVREQAIGENVFHRRAEYAAQDSIVRTEARNLRKRLEVYFETEGKDEPLTVCMPKGGYWLSFQPKETLAAQPEKAEASHARSFSHPETGGAQASSKSSRKTLVSTRSLRSYRIICVALALTTVCASVLALHWRGKGSEAKGGDSGPPRLLPFSAMFSADRDTFIVTSDTGFWKIAELSKHRMTLDEYLERKYPSVPGISPPDLINNLSLTEYTDGEEMAIAGMILERNASFSRRIFLRSGHQIGTADFKDRNIILLGSRYSNPWATLYSDRLNFQFEWTTATIQFRNLSPRPGEWKTYPNSADDGYSYAQVAFIPNVSTNGNALLLAGTNGEATSAAGEFVLDDAQVKRALKTLSIDPVGPPCAFELLLRVRSFFGGSAHSEFISGRAHPN